MTTSFLPESTTVDADFRTASIIPFPIRPRSTAANPEERLARALTCLNAALQEQKLAIAAWRSVLGELKASANGLQDSLNLYQGNLRALGNSVSGLQAKARSLEAWADGVTAASAD